MRKYLCKAEVKDLLDSVTYTRKKIIKADSGWEALETFINELNLCMDIEFDDLRFEDLGPTGIFIDATRESYAPDCDTITVKELIDILSDFDPDSKVFTRDSSGICSIYGRINENLIEEESCEDE